MSNFIDIYPNNLEPEICQEIIRRYEEDTQNQYAGVVSGPSGSVTVRPEHKKCTELWISQHESWRDIDEIICSKVGELLPMIQDKYSAWASFGSFINDEGYRVKKYLNDGTEWFNWHIDVNGYGQAHRQLVMFWYLNTVEEGGETEFKVQDVKVKPEEGKLCTFPAFWTHEHRGNVPVSSTKYALSGWLTLQKKW